MNEQQPSYSEDERQSLRRGRMMSDLITAPGWKELEELAKVWEQIRTDILLMPSHERPDLKGLTKEEQDASNDYVKGVLAGIRLVISAPRAMIDDMKTTTAEHSEEENDEE